MSSFFLIDTLISSVSKKIQCLLVLKDVVNILRAFKAKVAFLDFVVGDKQL